MYPYLLTLSINLHCNVKFLGDIDSVLLLIKLFWHYESYVPGYLPLLIANPGSVWFKQFKETPRKSDN